MSFLISFEDKMKIVGKTLLLQLALFVGILLIVVASLSLYGHIDRVTFPTPFTLPDKASSLADNEKGKLLLDSITHQMRYELDSTFGWSCNDILFNRFLLDNRASRQYGVYHATKVLMDLYSMTIAKTGGSDRESQDLYEARINNFAISPRSFWFPSAEGSYKKGLQRCEKYKKGLDAGKEIYNCRTDDLYASFESIIGENLLGYAMGLLQDSQSLPFYTIDNRIYEVQGMVLVIRDFINTLYELYPEIKDKNNKDNMVEAMKHLDKICTYNPIYMTSELNCGELIVAHLTFAINRFLDIKNSLRI